MKQDKHSRFTNFSLAVFLYTKDQILLSVDQLDRTTKEFSFLTTTELDELIYLYKFGDRNDPRLQVEVHKYEQARRELLDLLNA